MMSGLSIPQSGISPRQDVSTSLSKLGSFSSWKNEEIVYIGLSWHVSEFFTLLIAKLMKTLFTLLLILAGIVFVVAVMLMTPKGGLGLGIWWAAGSNEYGSKKSIEVTLKRTALVAGILFCICALFLPYIK
jgi:protein translocase SecG subunit